MREDKLPDDAVSEVDIMLPDDAERDLHAQPAAETVDYVERSMPSLLGGGTFTQKNDPAVAKLAYPVIGMAMIIGLALAAVESMIF